VLFCPIPHAALSPRASPACHRQRAPSAPQSTPSPPVSCLPRKPSIHGASPGISAVNFYGETNPALPPRSIIAVALHPSRRAHTPQAPTAAPAPPSPSFTPSSSRRSLLLAQTLASSSHYPALSSARPHRSTTSSPASARTCASSRCLRADQRGTTGAGGGVRAEVQVGVQGRRAALARNATRATAEATGDGLEPSTPAPWRGHRGQATPRTSSPRRQQNLLPPSAEGVEDLGRAGEGERRPRTQPRSQTHPIRPLLPVAPLFSGRLAVATSALASDPRSRFTATNSLPRSIFFCLNSVLWEQRGSFGRKS
jgi:hypothetical protein